MKPDTPINPERVSLAREDAGLSQQETADASGIPRSTIAAIESGKSKKPGFPVVTVLAKTLNVDGESLFLPSDVDLSTKAAS